MKIYTKTGDQGTTALYGGTRVPKHHLRIESYGTLDELNSWLGLLRDQKINTIYEQQLLTIQAKLFTIGAVLATPSDKEQLKNGKERLAIPKISNDDIRFLEEAVDTMEADLAQMTHFILPGGHTTVSYCHIARTVCRRSERLITLLNEHETIATSVLAYINRLSDYLFVLSRAIGKELNAEEVKWIPEKIDQ